MTQLSNKRKTLCLKAPVISKDVVLEYRLIWNQAKGEWSIHRNGLDTGLARHKKQSAIDRAILAIRSDEGLPDANSRVVSMKDGVLTTEWTSPTAIKR